MENSQYIQAFLDESRENTQILNTCCLQIEAGEREEDVFATMFRAAHTLKGMSATMGFTGMARLTHKLEDVLGYVRDHPTQMNEDLLDAVFASIDALDADLDCIQDKGVAQEANHEPLLDRLTAATASLGNSGGVPQARDVDSSVERPRDARHKETSAEIGASLRDVMNSCVQNGMCCGEVVVTIDECCALKGARAVLVATTIDRFADSLQCEPEAMAMEQGEYDDSLRFFIVLHDDSPQHLVSALFNLSEVTNVEFHPWIETSEVAAGASVESTVSVEEQAPPESGGTHEGHVHAQPQSQAATVTTAGHHDYTVRVPVDRLDTLMNLLSELVIDRTRLTSLTAGFDDGGLKDVINHLSRISNELQSAVMSLRMVPVASLFQRFPRMVRDLAKTLNKSIDLKMTGLQTEFDRTIVDEMAEALVHLIRNAADHGLESEEERVRAGKQATGTIWLRAYAAGQHVVIEVSDDGQGIRRDKVVQKAVSAGVITSEAAAALTEDEMFMLLFEPGFSTSETISNISGRGVGLDAVKSKVESLGGTISVSSEEHVETTFRIQLPLTLSILEALLVRVGTDIFAIPLGVVEEVALVAENQVRQVQGHTMLDTRHQLIPVLDARDWLCGRADPRPFPWRAVICRDGKKRVAVVVDELRGRQEIVNKSLGRYLSGVRQFSGATILGDGGIALIIDIHHFLTAS